jgi:LytS/YehU family sensor histidine kinase
VHSSEEAGRAFIPALTVQPLVENSIKHGISPKIEGGAVNVCAEIENHVCRISVRDNGVGFGSKSEKGTGHGLDNIRERMSLVFGENVDVRIVESDGVRVELIFPAENQI